MNEQFIIPNVGAITLAGLVRTALVNASLHLFTNQIIPTPSTVIGDLDEATFSGYAPVTPVVWGAAFIDPTLGGASFQTYKQWDFDGADLTPTSNSVWGFWLESSAGNLLAVSTFPQAIAMAAAGDALIANPKINF